MKLLYLEKLYRVDMILGYGINRPILFYCNPHKDVDLSPPVIIDLIWPHTFSTIYLFIQ